MTLVVALMATVCFAKADNKQMQLVKADGVAAIFDNNKTAKLEYVFTDDCTATYQVGTTIPLKQYISVNGEWDEEWAEAGEGFSDDWNKRNKKGMLITAGDKTDYTIRVTIGAFKEVVVMVYWWEITTGKVEIIDNATNEVVVAYNIHEYYESCSGFKALKLRNRIKETLSGLSESCLNFAKKANK